MINMQIIRALLFLSLVIAGTKGRKSEKKYQMRLMNEINIEMGDLKSKLGELEERIKTASNGAGCSNQTNKGVTRVSGAIYTRWGRKKCPGDETDLVYSGYTGGSWYTHSGAATNFLCMPKSPEWGFYQQDTFENHAFVYGAEYETSKYKINKETLNSKLEDQDVPCAVCQSKFRSSKIMIPARKTCMDGWYKEYRGYLMAGFNSNSNGATEYICVDAKPETVHGGSADQNGRLLSPVEAQCGSLKCPPYVNNRELTCVVCTR